MNFPHETENSYLSGGNCLNLGVNPSGEVYFKEFLYPVSYTHLTLPTKLEV